MTDLDWTDHAWLDLCAKSGLFDRIDGAPLRTVDSIDFGNRFAIRNGRHFLLMSRTRRIVDPEWNDWALADFPVDRFPAVTTPIPPVPALPASPQTVVPSPRFHPRQLRFAWFE